MNRRAKQIIAGAIMLCSYGCASLNPPIIDATKQETNAIQSQVKSRTTTATIVDNPRPRLSGDSIIIRQDQLPAVMNRQVSYTTRGILTLDKVIEDVSKLTGIRIWTTEVVQKTDASMQKNDAQDLNRTPITIEHNGTLKQLLDVIADHADASWRYNPKYDQVEIYRYATRTFSLYLPPGSKTIDASISLSGVSSSSSGASGASGSGGASSSSGGGNVSVEQSLTIDPWTSVMKGIQAILDVGEKKASTQSIGDTTTTSQTKGATGKKTGGSSQEQITGRMGMAIANQELGIVTVTARPYYLERIATYIDSINKRFAQNVLIDIRIYNVTAKKGASAGAQLNLLYSQLDKYGLSIAGQDIIKGDGALPAKMVLDYTNPYSRFEGSQLIVQALSEVGEVALQTQGQVIAINGQPAPIQVANEVTYLERVSTTTTQNVGTTTSLTPGTKVVGFTGNFIPLILGDNRILLQYQMQISQLTGMLKVSSGDSAIQAPQIASQTLQQQAFVRDGQMIMLVGFDQNRAGRNTSLSFGGVGRTGEETRDMLVIVMQVNGGQRNGEI